MARLQIRHSDRSIGEGRTARVVRLSGSIDTSTVARFDAEVGEALIGATRLAVMLFTEVE